MRALTWQGRNDVRVETMPDPEIVNPRDAIIEVTATAICGSDLHLYDGVIPGVLAGDILGHKFMGRVVDTGPDSTLKKGDRVVVPFSISRPTMPISIGTSCRTLVVIEAIPVSRK